MVTITAGITLVKSTGTLTYPAMDEGKDFLKIWKQFSTRFDLYAVFDSHLRWEVGIPPSSGGCGEARMTTRT